MLALNLTRIRAAQERFEHVYDPGQVAQGQDDFRMAAPAVLAFDIFKDKQHFRLAGRVTTTLELRCSRCLEPFTLPVDTEFDLRYHPRAETPGDVEREIEEDDLTTAFYEHDEIDLGQLMQEQFYLSLPMKPLCMDNCQGLCPVCGSNRNRSACRCDQHWEDPRLAALKALTPLKKES